MKMLDEKDLLVSMSRISSSTNALTNDQVNCQKCYDFFCYVGHLLCSNNSHSTALKKLKQERKRTRPTTTLNKIKIEERKEQPQERGTLATKNDYCNDSERDDDEQNDSCRR